MKGKKINFKAMAAAVSAGAGYNFAIEGAAKHVDFINDNYLVTKSLAGAVIGSGMVYFAKPTDETTRAAGYGILGVAGAAGATKLATVLVTSSDEPINGISDRNKKIISRVISRGVPGNRKPQFLGVPSAGSAAMASAQQARPGMAQPSGASMWLDVFGRGNFSDGIYS